MPNNAANALMNKTPYYCVEINALSRRSMAPANASLLISRPCRATLRPPFAARGITFVNFCNLAFRPDFFALPRFARRRFFSRSFRRDKIPAMRLTPTIQAAPRAILPSRKRSRNLRRVVKGNLPINNIIHYSILTKKKYPKTAKKILDAPLKRIFMPYHTT